MGIIAKPFVFVDGGTVSHSEWNSNFDTLYNEFNGNIDDANIKAGANISGSKLANASITAGKLAAAAVQDSHMDYQSVKVVRSGPNIGGANGVRLARGGKAFTLVAGSQTGIVITFATDSDDGDPAFTSAPKVVFGVETAGINKYSVKITAKSSSSITIRIDSTNGADVSSGTIHWIAMGNV